MSARRSSTGGSSSALGRVDLLSKNLLNILAFSVLSWTTLSRSTRGGIAECLFFLVNLSKIPNFFLAEMSLLWSVELIEL